MDFKAQHVSIYHKAEKEWEELGMFIITGKEEKIFDISKRIILYPSRIILKLILILVEKFIFEEIFWVGVKRSCRKIQVSDFIKVNT